MRIVPASSPAAAAAACALLLLVSGCRPFHILGQQQIALEPLVINGRFAVDTPPSANAGRVCEMPVGPSCGAAAGPKVAIVDVDGLLVNNDLTGLYSLGENPVSLFQEKLEAIAAAPHVVAVVVRINSPGGSVTASDIMWNRLRAFRTQTQRPVIACLMDVGAGGAYYLATAADQVIAHPTTVTGGIGVILNLYNLRETMAQVNVLGQSIKAGPNIDMGAPTHPLTPDARKLLQGMADEFHQRFKTIVKQARPDVAVDDETLFDGRVFSAHQALQHKLIDRVGYLEDAVALAQQKAGVDRAQVVLFHRPNDPVHSPYAVTPNTPLQGSSILPISVPGLDRSRMPAFLYLWEPEVTLERLGGR